MKRIALIALAAAEILAACANPGIVQMSPDTYMLTRTDKGGILAHFVPLSKATLWRKVSLE